MNQPQITNHKSPLLVIVGETASGKSVLALQIAQELDGEIICADSRTVYKGMDIGTAKPSAQEQKKVRHHLLDVVKPNQPFTVVEFKKHADAAIEDATTRGKLPILVGGSGLYIDAVIFDYAFTRSPQSRDAVNPRHASEGTAPSQRHLRKNTITIGISLSVETLQIRLQSRVASMVKMGLKEEVHKLSLEYGWDVEPMKSIGYGEWRAYFEGAQTLEEAQEAVILNSQRLAKKQRTWFKRNSDIHWFDNQTLAFEWAVNRLIPSINNGQAKTKSIIG